MRPRQSFFRALSYFTIVPVPAASGPPEPGDLAMLPLVGACVGFASGSIAYGSSTFLPKRVAAAVAFALPIVLTGALHLDGFLDVCDGAFASVDAERRREIMRDPRHGTYAFAGGCIYAIASYASIAELEPRAWPRTLALAETTARLATLIASTRVPTATSGTAARAFARAQRPWLLGAQASAVLLAARACGTRDVAATLVALGLGIPIAASLAKRFEGELTGDAYGFCITTIHTAFCVLRSHAKRS